MLLWLLLFIKIFPELDIDTIKSEASNMDSLYICQDSEISAKVAVSCTLGIAYAIATGAARNGFALVRPPGHHADETKVINTDFSRLF